VILGGHARLLCPFVGVVTPWFCKLAISILAGNSRHFIDAERGTGFYLVSRVKDNNGNFLAAAIFASNLT
jgi:hypothetical protein